MSDETRLDPDALLKKMQESEERARTGELRVFLGMSAGVGKTYAMLKAAHQRLKEGVDVVVGMAVTHGRSETEALLTGLPLVPLKKFKYRDANFEELDLDAILLRQPELVIIDELAHTNAAGSRHEKRYQDILEILDAGIDVYTALNVQHLESRKDSVEAITGIVIRETVPDSILERATLVELVDIAPTELLKRLQEGKVYFGDKAKRATEFFFKEDRLTALREIALRMTAERVDQDLQKILSTRHNTSPWPTNERLLVAISHSPYSEKLIRTTRRLAYNLEAPWIAVHVNTGLHLSDKDQAQLTKNLNLARELKAEVIATTETDVTSAIKRICRIKNVTQVIVGRPAKSWIREVLEGGSLLDRLVKESLDVDIHVIRKDSAEMKSPSLKEEISLYKTESGPLKYWYTLCFIFIVAGLGEWLDNFIGYRAVGFIFMLAVLAVGLFGSIGAVLLAAILSAITWNFLFIPPRFTFVISEPDDIILYVSFFVVALITGFLTNRLRFHEKLIRDREERTNFLYEILRDIANSEEKSEFITKVTTRVGNLFKADCGVILKSASGDLRFDKSNSYGVNLNEKEKAVVIWSFQNQKQAGWSTDTLSQSKALYIPMKGLTEAIGVFIFHPQKKFRKLDMEQKNLLFSITRQLGVSIERYFLAKRLHETQRLKDSQELQQTLLNSISHEMRTPLTVILSTATSLEEEIKAKNSDYVKNAAENLLEAGDRLNRVIENLLDMSRLSSGVLSLKLEWHDLSDLIGVVIKKYSKNMSKHKLQLIGLNEMTFVNIDFRLMEHAISNLLLNAAAYSPPQTEIKIQVIKDKKKLTLEVEDEGPGIAEEFVPHIFEKFYRVPGTPTGGTGLGLSIVKSIVELHKGEIQYVSRRPKGSCFRILLPMEEAPKILLE